jgi:galactose mutarotase-like enzyme
MSGHTHHIITLRHGRSSCQVCPQAGGVITRYWQELDDGTIREWLSPATADTIDQCGPPGMSCFPLVPLSGRIHNGRFRFRE